MHVQRGYVTWLAKKRYEAVLQRSPTGYWVLSMGSGAGDGRLPTPEGHWQNSAETGGKSTGSTIIVMRHDSCLIRDIGGICTSRAGIVISLVKMRAVIMSSKDVAHLHSGADNNCSVRLLQHATVFVDSAQRGDA
jgi:hypothetical protein